MSHESERRARSAPSADERAEIAPGAPPKRPWVPPRLVELPPLRDVTLQTGGVIQGGPTIFP